MKILCEVAPKVKQYDQSEFHWLQGPENFLFSFEEKRRLRMFSIKQDLAHEVQSASLAESRHCTSLSWNKDESLLAIVVDKRQIYLWEVRRNNFTQFKPHSIVAGSGEQAASANSLVAKRKANKSIELVAWSNLSNKLAICYASGQILLCEIGQFSPSNQMAKEADSDEQSGGAGFVSVWERFIDNSESLLKQIATIEVSDQADIFACFSVISEILIMTFDGHTKFYSQGDRANLYNAKFSPLKREHCSRTGQHLGHTICLAYQSGEDALLTKRISLDLDEFESTPPRLHLLRDSLVNQTAQNHGQPPGPRRQLTDTSSQLVNFYWLTPNQLLLCFSSGVIQLIQLSPRTSTSPTPSGPGSNRFELNLCTELLRIGRASAGVRPSPSPDSASQRSLTGSNDPRSSLDTQNDPFKIFELVKAPKRQDESQSFALAAGTSYRLHYYELYNEGSQRSGSCGFSFEHFDEVDLGESLHRVRLKLERARWSSDCSMLSVQLTSGHLLVYRTCLQEYMVTSYGPRTAFLSGSNEVTILNYGTEQSSTLLGSSSEQQAASGTNQTSGNAAGGGARHDNALILGVQLRPSLLAIGPNHLALALNNRVRFYSFKSIRSACENASNSPTGSDAHYHEQEYAAIVKAVGLSSRFVAIQFDDQRLKLHSLRNLLNSVESPVDGDEESAEERSHNDDEGDDERFFPDPSRPERITAFAITEQLLVYCTHKCQISIFCLKSWKIAQVCDHSSLFANPIQKIKPNARGNKFMCLMELRDPSASQRPPVASARVIETNAFLYDLYSNTACPVAPKSTDRGGQIWLMLLQRQIELTFATLPLGTDSVQRLLQGAGLTSERLRRPPLSGVTDAIWDTDGRTVLLIERKSIHVLAVLDHTLEREESVVEYAASAKKPSSYMTLYASQGIVSYQTSLGRVINSILETHDDDLKLGQLEMRIQEIKSKCLHTGGRSSGSINDVDAANGFADDHRVSVLEGLLEVMLLKVSYLCTVLPIYSLPKCRDICKHLMEYETFNFDVGEQFPGDGLMESGRSLINQMIWKVLAAWSLLTLNLDFASLIYRENNLHVQSKLLALLYDDIRCKRSNMARSLVKDRILALLGIKNAAM